MQPHPAVIPILALVALPVLMACDRSGPGRRVTIQDSAGTTIVTSGATDLPLTWTVRSLFRLGGADAEPEAFYQVNARLVTVDGADNMTVADPMAARIHQFAPDGTHRWSAGSRGGGPGEFEHPSVVSATSDGALAVLDSRRRAILFFSSSGQFAGEHRAPSFAIRVAHATAGEVVERWHYGSDGRVASLSVVTGADTLPIVRTSPVQTSTAQFAGCGPGPARQGPLMLAPELAWYLRDSTIAAATGPGYAIGTYDVHGRLLRSIRRALPGQAATVADAERWAADNPIIYTRGTSECRITTGEMVEKIGYADSLPAIAQVVVAPDGTLWVRRWSVTGHDGAIDIFDPAGGYVGTLPHTFPFPLHVRADGRLLYAEKDALDVERLVVGEIVRH